MLRGVCCVPYVRTAAARMVEVWCSMRPMTTAATSAGRSSSFACTPFRYLSMSIQTHMEHSIMNG